jgi:hypothetical protein
VRQGDCWVDAAAGAGAEGCGDAVGEAEERRVGARTKPDYDNHQGRSRRLIDRLSL